MYNTVNQHQAPLKIAELERLRDIAPASRTGEGSLLGRLSRGAGNLRHWLSRARDDRHAHFQDDQHARVQDDRHARFQPEPLDDHTLSDIGIPRIEALYWDPK